MTDKINEARTAILQQYAIINNTPEEIYWDEDKDTVIGLLEHSVTNLENIQYMNETIIRATKNNQKIAMQHLYPHYTNVKGYIERHMPNIAKTMTTLLLYILHTEEATLEMKKTIGNMLTQIAIL